MKKLLLAGLALAVIAFVPAKEVEITTGREIHLHKHAEAASATWQCRKCGERRYGGFAPKEVYWCGGVFENKHVWERLD